MSHSLLRHGCLFVLLGLATATSARALDIASLQIEKSGVFQVDGLPCAVNYYGRQWERTLQFAFRPLPEFPQKDETAWSTQSSVEMTSDQSAISFTESLKRTEEGGIQLSTSAEHSAAITGKGFFLEITIPVAIAQGKSFQVDSVTLPFPATQKTPGLHTVTSASRVVIPSKSGALSIQGKFSVHVQDNRQWGSANYLVRIGFVTLSESPYHAELNAQIQLDPSH